jgi:hypothetical protein
MIRGKLKVKPARIDFLERNWSRGNGKLNFITALLGLSRNFKVHRQDKGLTFVLSRG